MGVFSFLGDALNDILGGNSSRRDSERYNLQNMEIQQGYTRENMELQNQYNIEAFQRENDYNSPLAQQERLRRAGLNVNWSDAGSAIAQQDSGVSSSSPPGAMPSGSNAGSLGDLISIGSAVKDLKVKQSQIDLNKALEEKAKSDSFKAEEEGKGQSFQNWLQENYGVGEKEAGISLSSESAQLTSKQKENYFSESVARIGKMLAERENIDLTNDQLKIVLKYLTQDIVSRINLQNAQIPYYGSMANLNNINAAYVPLNAHSNYLSAQGSVMSGQAALGQVAVAKERNRIEWKLAESLETLQDYQGQKINAETIGLKIMNGLSAWAYNEGISRKVLKRECLKLGLDAMNAYQQYLIDHPKATWADFDKKFDTQQRVLDVINGTNPFNPSNILKVAK